MCCPTKNFESESKFKSKRVPKRVQLNSLDNNSSFEDRNKPSCIKGGYPFKDYI